MVKKFAMRRPSIVTILSMVLPLVVIVGIIALDGRFNGGVEKMTDAHWVEMILTMVLIFTVVVVALFWFSHVRYEITINGIAIFFGPFRHGITWASVRKIELYHLPFSKKPFGVAVKFRALGLPHRKILMPDNVVTLYQCMLDAWQEHKGTSV